jgi:hypothetical protein
MSSSNFKKAVIVVAVLALVAWLGGTGSADIIFSHSGTNNPTGEGWTQYTGGSGWSGGGEVDGADDGSWEIGTPNKAEYRTYDHTNDLTDAQLTLAAADGYTLAMEVKVQTGAVPQNVYHEIGGQALVPGTLHNWSSVGFGSDAQGNVLVGLWDGGNFGTTAVVPGSASDYHTYVLNWKPSNGKEDLYVDGSPLIVDHTPATFPSSWGLEHGYINFGANDGTATGFGWYRSVTFSIGNVPEPSTIVMLVFGAASLLVYGWYRRKR